MRKLILNLAMSLDGFIEDQNGAFDWCFTDQDYGMTEFLSQTGAILFGRKSYELMLQYETAPEPYPDKMKYVFSRQLKTEAPNTEVLSGPVAEEVQKLKQQPGKDIWLYGGANLAGQVLQAGLLDVLMLSVHPVLLGKGKPLFQDQSQRVPLTLTHTQTYNSGLVQLWYKVEMQ